MADEVFTVNVIYGCDGDCAQRSSDLWIDWNGVQVIEWKLGSIIT